MLIECSYCGAPLDVKGNQRLCKCTYCGTTSKLKENRTVAFETPQGWQPPPRWQPPAHVPADSSKTLVYHAASAVKRVVSLVITLSILGTLIPVVILVMQQQKAVGSPEIAGVLQAAQSAIDQARERAKTAGAMAAAPEENLFEGSGAVDLAAKFRERLGGKPVRAIRVVLYPAYAILEAQDPERPSHVDRYLYRAGVINDPQPVNVQSLRGKLQSELFTLDDVVLDKLPDLVLGTLTELNYEEAKASHVIIERNTPFSKGVVMRIYVSGPRESGRIDYSGEGKVLRMYK